MKVIQILTTIAFGDAVGNNSIAIKEFLQKKGIETEIYAENIDQKLPNGTAKHIDKLKKLEDEDIIIYHYAIGCDLNRRVSSFGGRVIMQYHNVTPPDFFRGYNDMYYNVCKAGVDQLKEMKNVPILCLADSEYNKQDLINAGFECPIEVCPILIPYDDYKKAPNASVIERYNDEWTNFLFVGRIAPNKCQEDVIKTFAWYKNHINNKTRLFLVGSEGIPEYSERIRDYIEKLGVEDVIFPGHIKFDEILAYYSIADVFLCMSQHEGFCVPIVEAMLFDLPIVARDTTAIPYTMGKGGLLVKDSNPVVASMTINRLLEDEQLKDYVLSEQKIRLGELSNDSVEMQLSRILEKVL